MTMEGIEHDTGKERNKAIIYRWNEPLHRVDWWSNAREMWINDPTQETTVNINFDCLVTYEDTWCEPCEGVTDENS